MQPPALFILHGSPMLAIEGSPARRSLMELAEILPRPERILVASAHWETARPVVATGSRPQTVHDFRGYSAPSNPDCITASIA